MGGSTKKISEWLLEPETKLINDKLKIVNNSYSALYLHAHECNKSVIIKADTGASWHYSKIEDKHILRNKKK